MEIELPTEPLQVAWRELKVHKVCVYMQCLNGNKMTRVPSGKFNLTKERRSTASWDLEEQQKTKQQTAALSV